MHRNALHRLAVGLIDEVEVQPHRLLTVALGEGLVKVAGYVPVPVRELEPQALAGGKRG